MKPEIITKVAPKYTGKFTVVVDLMAEVSANKTLHPHSPKELIIILPGLKTANLSQRLLLKLEIAEYIYSKRQ